MPLYDYQCSGCGAETEKMATVAERREQRCADCDALLEIVHRPQRHYQIFQNYFDIGLGVKITGRDHRRRVMRDGNWDRKDPPSRGDHSARLDRIADSKRREAQRG